MNHSPLPWSVEEPPETPGVRIGDGAPTYRIKHASAMAKDYQVAELYGEICFNAKDDAEFIVRAANNFEALRNACANLVEQFDQMLGTGTWVDRTGLCGDLEYARAALVGTFDDATPEPDTAATPPKDSPSDPQ